MLSENPNYLQDYLIDRFDFELNELPNPSVLKFDWPSAEVFKTMSPDDYKAAFVEWRPNFIAETKEKVRDYLQENGCLDRFLRLEKAVENNYCIPLVGAGLSIPSGYKLWGDFLLSLLADFPRLKSSVEDLLNKNAYVEAADLIVSEQGREIFNEEIRSQMGHHKTSFSGPVRLLPALFSDEVFTTNFDYVLSNVYKSWGLEFENDIFGANLEDTLTDLSNNSHCLIRLHGNGNTARGRVITSVDYENLYSDGKLKDLITKTCGRKSILYIGCSITNDKLFECLEEIKAEAKITDLGHFAILPGMEEDRRAEARKQLARAGIHPIYYPPEDHDDGIESLLLTLVHGGLND